jgi:hypothetical protein
LGSSDPFAIVPGGIAQIGEIVQDTPPVSVTSVNDHQFRLESGSGMHPTAFVKEIVPTKFGSSFISFHSLVRFHAPEVGEALEYWLGQWDIQPSTLREYEELNGPLSVQPGSRIRLWHEDVSYWVIVDDHNRLIMEGRKVIYESQGNGGPISVEEGSVFINPEDGSISGFDVTRAFARYSVRRKVPDRHDEQRGWFTVATSRKFRFRDESVAGHFECSRSELTRVSQTTNQFKVEVVSCGPRNDAYHVGLHGKICVDFIEDAS